MAGYAMYCLALACSSPSRVGGGGSVGLVAAMERAGGERAQGGQAGWMPGALTATTECVCPPLTIQMSTELLQP